MAETTLHRSAVDSGYHEHARPEMLAFVPPGVRRVLDVGCGAGEFSSSLKQALPHAEVWGVEPNAAAHAAACQVLDRVLLGGFDDRLALADGQFDAIVFNDSLEHFPDHVPPLALARRLLKPGGSLVASIPNVRYWPHLKHYLFKADWRYEDDGIRDRTHLRFFTQRSILRMLDEAGFDVQKIQGINPCWRDARHPIARFVLPASMQDILYLQFAVTARVRPLASQG